MSSAIKGHTSLMEDQVATAVTTTATHGNCVEMCGREFRKTESEKEERQASDAEFHKTGIRATQDTLNGGSERGESLRASRCREINSHQPQGDTLFNSSPSRCKTNCPEHLSHALFSYFHFFLIFSMALST